MPLNPNQGYGQAGYGTGGWGGGSGAPFALPIEYYLALVTSQYRLSPNMLAWLAADIQIDQDILQCLYQWQQMAFDLDQAVGPQLDALGALIGQSRTVGFQPSNSVSPILDDATYRILLKARVARNHWDGRLTSLQGVWQSLFAGGAIIIDDAMNMSATIIMTGAFTSIIQDLITHGYIVPRPQGVLYTYTFGTLPLLGTDRNDAYIAGADTGHAA